MYAMNIGSMYPILTPSLIESISEVATGSWQDVCLRSCVYI